MKYHKSSIIYASFVLASTALVSCESKNTVNPRKNPSETEEVRSLKTYYASIAKVSVDHVLFDQNNDVFSIDNQYKITYVELLKNYNESSTGRIQ